MERIVMLVSAVLVISFPSHAAAASQPVPAHESFTLHSAKLGEIRRINVYVPPGYAAEKDTHYPVLYMPDGGMQEDFPHVTTDVDTAIRAGEMRSMIVVGIENTKRRRDMTGPTTVASDREIAPVVGGSAGFRAFIADELMPEVRRRYRTNGHTAIVGESLAGLFVLETFFLQPTLFNTFISLSPSLWWNNEALVHASDARLKSWPHGLNRTLYFATASDDGNAGAAAILLKSLRVQKPQGLTWYYKARSDLKHSNIYRLASPAIFRKLFPVK